VQDGFDRAASLPTGDARETFLNEVAADAPQVAEQIRALLRVETQASVFLGGVVDATRQFEPYTLQPGQQVGHYRIVECLAAGGMGVVYRAHDTRLQRDVALKFLQPASADDPERRHRFFDEARAASRLDHENICAIHEIGETDAHHHYIVMALCPGEDLGRVLRQRALSIEEILRYALQLCDALEAAHGAGIVHRDLKPANVIVGDNGKVKLVDFGIALMGRHDATASRAQAPVGTIVYMAPEQLGDEAIDLRCDLWAIGVTLYEALTGRRPFRGDAGAVIRAIRNDDPEPPSAVVSGVPPALEAVVMRCLRRSPGQRYASAAALRAELERVQRAIAGDPAAALAPARSAVTLGLKHAREPAAAPDGACYVAVLAARLGGVTTAQWHELVARFGGRPVATQRDGELAVFGYPLADEFAVQRSVRCGLSLTALGTAAAAAAGPAWIVSREHTEPTLGGDVFEEALALAESTDAGDLDLTPAAYALVRGFVRAEPTDAGASSGATARYRVAGGMPARGRLETFVGAELTPFVGRVHELGLLKEAWARCIESDHPPILVAGEPGIGKSRLVHEFERSVIRDSRVVPMEFICSPHESASPLQPVSSHFQSRVFGGSEAERPAPLERVAEFAAAHGVVEPEVRLALTRLLGAPEPDWAARIALTPEAFKEKTLEALLRVICAHAARDPRLVIFEDLHWADPTTLELFERLQQAAARGVLVIGTHRPEFRPLWGNAAQITRLGLTRLRKPQAAQMLDSTAAGRSLDATRRAYALDKAEGNPLYIEELSSALAETGAATGDVPETLRGALLARLDRLGEAKDLVRTAAVLGRQFDLPLLEATQGWPRTRLDRALQALLGGGLVLREGYAQAAVYRFKHALIRDAAYESLERDTRREQHAKAAAALVERFPERTERQPELAAYHYAQAGDDARAADYWTRAAAKALASFAILEATQHARAGLEAVRALPPSGATLELELKLHTTLGPALMATHGYADAQVNAVYSRAREICGLLGNPPAVFPVLFGLWTFHCVRALHADALELAEQLVALAAAANSKELRTEAHMVRGITRYYQGDFRAAEMDFATAWDAYAPADSLAHIVRYGQDPGMVIRSYQSWTESMLGAHELGDRHSAEAIAIARGTEHPFSIAYGLTFAAWHALNRGRAAEAEQLLTEAIMLGRDQKLEVFLALALALDALRQIAGGELAEGRDAMERAVAHFRATGAELFLPAWFGALAQAAFASGDAASARALIADAIARSQRTQERWCLPELRRIEAQLATKTPTKATTTPSTEKP
jgi:predicted ATPase